MFKKNYMLINIVNKNELFTNMVVKKNDSLNNKALFSVSEISDKAMIINCLKSFTILKQFGAFSDMEDCFSEDGKLYIVFKYNQYETLDRYIYMTNPGLEEIMDIAKNLILSLSKYIDTNIATQLTILRMDNILYNEGEILFNFFIDEQLRNPDLLADDVYDRIGDVLTAIFSDNFINRNKNASIIIQKCRKHLYTCFPEIYKDLSDLSIDEQGLFSKKTVGEKADKLKPYIFKVSMIAVSIFVVYFLFTRFIVEWRAEPAFNEEIRRIGTVQVMPVQTDVPDPDELIDDIIVDNINDYNK